jgi:hypothetical protein
MLLARQGYRVLPVVPEASGAPGTVGGDGAAGALPLTRLASCP